MTAPVFVVEPGALAGLNRGDTWALTGAEGRHAVSVQRLRAGESVEVVDGAGVRLRGHVTGATGHDLTIAVDEISTQPPPATEIVLVQALAKGGRDELAIEAATELGVDAVLPWQSQRSVVQWRAEKVARGMQRWQALVQAASKVARRSRLPQVLDFVRGAALAEFVAEQVRSGALVLVLHEEAAEPLVRVPVAGLQRIVIIVGPEGGLSDDEVQALTCAGGRAVLLGTNVLRASTAGPAAVAALSSSTGRWG